MVIYTKRGDMGATGLFKGDKRVSKSSLRINAIGTVDELNSYLGVAISFSKDKKISYQIGDIQRNLLTIGSILAGSKLRFTVVQTKKLEELIDDLEGKLPVLSSFILPGGTKLAAHFQYARTLARRAEREVVTLSKVEEVKPQILIYLNRLSDTLFMFARNVNYEAKAQEKTWKGRRD